MFIGIVATLALVAGGGYVWAVLNTSSSGFARSVVWKDADVQDYTRFPSRTIERGEDPVVLPVRPGPPTLFDGAVPEGDLDQFLEETQTAAFIAIQNGSVVYEKYFNGYRRDSTVTSFSVAKSYVSTLVGIALESGHIQSLDDSVTDYVPELLARDNRFRRITVRHLLTMSSGLRWSELGLPWSDDAETYYGTDLRRLAIEDTAITGPPGKEFLYNPYNTLLLGLVLERATTETVSKFMEEELWQPMGATANGSWSLDSHESGYEKMESGLNARAMDMVKLGLVFLQRGKLNGNRIVGRSWVTEATSFSDQTSSPAGYGYHWWSYHDPELNRWFAAQGNKGQFIAVFPSKDLVIGRFGIDFGYPSWPSLFADMAKTLPSPRGRR